MSVYTTAQLLAVNEKKFKFDPLFLRIFFRETYPFSTEKVYLSQIPGLVNMALYVSPIVSGKVIRSRGGSTSEFTPGYVKPKTGEIYRPLNSVPQACDFPAENGTRKGPTAFCA